jgi:N-acetylneuraminic acid mutarotase
MKSKFVLAFFIIPICFIYSQQNNWSSIGKMISPVACGEVLYNGMQGNPKFYLLGGYSVDYLQTRVNWIQEYNIVNGTWKMFPFSMKSSRGSFIAGLWDSTTIVCLGGSKDNYLESFDFINGNESVVYDTNYNFNRLNASGHVVGNDLFVIGGTNAASADNFPFIADYNLKQKKITYSFSFLNFFKDAQDIMTVVVDSSIYLIGGVINTPVNMINKFSISDKNLSLLPQHLSLPRAGGSAVYNANSKKIYVIGGYDQINSALSTVEVIEFNRDGTISISDGPPLKTARKYPMAISYGNKIYVFGGYNQSNQVVSDIEVYTDTIITEVIQSHLPDEFALLQNYPNPFNPTTTIKYDLPKEANVILKVYNILGEEVATLVNKLIPAGHQSVAFNAVKLASGMYIYRIEAGGFVQVKKMLLMK